MHEVLHNRLGRPFWAALAAVMIVAGGLCFFRLGDWPWDCDEVSSLLELGLLDENTTETNISQLGRLSQLLPVWYFPQRNLLRVLPVDEFGTRVFSAACGALTVVFAFAMSWIWRGPRFAFALAILISMSQCFLWLSQQNRFYSTGMLFLTLTMSAVMWRTHRRIIASLAVVILALLAVLSHNLIVVYFGIALIAACVLYPLGITSSELILKAMLAVGVTAAAYFFYLRPIMAGWISGGTGGTHPLVAMIDQVGPPTIALSLLGCGFLLQGRADSRPLAWWGMMWCGCFMFVLISPWIIPSWNPRYALFFTPPVWVLAAFAIEQVAAALVERTRIIAWYVCVGLLLAPGLISHFQDGSRHDLRSAAAIVKSVQQEGEKVYCNWPLTLSYYLGSNSTVHDAFSTEIGPENYLVVDATTNWAPLPHGLQRQVEVIDEIKTRRFDGKSFVVRILRVLSKASTDKISASAKR